MHTPRLNFVRIPRFQTESLKTPIFLLALVVSVVAHIAPVPPSLAKLTSTDCPTLMAKGPKASVAFAASVAIRTFRRVL